MSVVDVVFVYVVGFLVLALVIVLRVRKEDIPDVVRALAEWWRAPK